MTPSQSPGGTPPLDSEISASHESAPRAHTSDNDKQETKDRRSVNTQLFIDPMLGVPLSFYVHEDTADREAVMSAIKTHGGATVKTYSSTQYMLVNPKRESGQNLWRLYSHKRGRVVLDARWIFECIDRDSILSMGHMHAWGGFKVKGNERNVLEDNSKQTSHGTASTSSSVPAPSSSPKKHVKNASPRGNPSNPSAEHPHQRIPTGSSANSLPYGMSPWANAPTPGGGPVGPVMAHGYPGPAYGGPTGSGDTNAPPYGMLPWTDEHGQTYHPFLYYHPAQYAYPHPQPPRSSHPYEGSSNQQPPVTHSPSAGDASEGVQSPAPTDEPPRGRKRKRTPEPVIDASSLVRPIAPARRSPTPPKQSVTSSHGGNRFTRADVTYLHKYMDYCREMGHVLSLREICEKLAIRAPHHSFFSWRRYCNRHKIRLGSFSMEDAVRNEADASHENGDDERLSDEDGEVEHEVSSRDNDDQAQPPEEVSSTAGSSRPADPPPQEVSQSHTAQSPSLQADPNIDPTLAATGSKLLTRATGATSNAGLPDDAANDRPAASPMPPLSATGGRSTAPEGSQTTSGHPARANASVASSAGSLILAPDEPRAPKVLARSTTGKGVAFTTEDVEFLVRFMAYRRRQEGGDLNMNQFWSDVTLRAPHHSRASWMKYWRRHHHELDGTPDDMPVTVPQAKRTRYSYDDDARLARFFATRPEGIQDTVFRQFATENPHHPWKGWQEHYRLHRAQILHLIARLERGENIDEPVDEIIDEVPT